MGARFCPVGTESELGTVGVGRRAVDAAESARANRRWWDADADNYHREHGAFLGDDRVLMRAQDVLEALRSAEHRLALAVTRERGELTRLEHEVVKSLADHETLAENIEAEYVGQRTLGERMSDRLASFGGSWTFISLFGVVLLVWMGFNIAVAGRSQFDPYPFILLNLVLSCLAAIQAPIIMMSQKRQEAKDRLRSENDYRVNLKAELEIRHLHEKMDHILTRQWERLAEIQQIQLEIMQEAKSR